MASAFTGQKPASAFDALVIEGFWRLAKSKDHKLRPSPPGAHPPVIPVKKPPNPNNDSRAWEIYAGMGALIALTILITGTRLLLRLMKKELRWGKDDWAIIVGTAFILVYASLSIEAARIGGAGKHIYNVTYRELNNYWFVSDAVSVVGRPRLTLCSA